MTLPVFSMLLPLLPLLLLMLCSVVSAQAQPGTAAKPCAAGSFSCAADCASVLLCLSDGTQVAVDTCAAGAVCDAAQHACVVGSACAQPPDTDQFLCHDFGYFPDPYDCTRFHVCLHNDSRQADQTVTCPEGRAYNALDARCSLDAESRPCSKGPVPACTKPGQMGAQTENHNIYYVCVRRDGALVPWLYRCPSAMVFNGAECVLGRRFSL